MARKIRSCPPENHPAHRLGKKGEDVAARFLLENGYEILERNWRGLIGEIDIIALTPASEVIIVEVKTRSSLAYGDPFEAITREKYQRIYRLGREWVAGHLPGSSWRIDAILLLKVASGFELIHHKGLIA